jgi:gliding motility-associated-like protein
MQKLFFTVALYVAALSTALAQEPFYNTRLKLQKVDCNLKQVQMDVEIRSLQKEHVFYLGDANFRFGYDGRLLYRPTLVGQHNFSREAANGQEYGVQNLNGSSENLTQALLSLNIFYTGSGQKPQKVSLEWMKIATIQFDIANAGLNTPSPVLWYTPQTFPKTGLSEVVSGNGGFELKVVKSGTFTNAEIPMISEACPNLASNSSTGPSIVKKPPVTKTPDAGTVPEADPIANVDNQVEETDLVIPDGFSPNGDGINDVFTLQNKKGVKVSLQIYNRYGGLVYSNADYRNDWAGLTEEGKATPDGTYFSVIKSGDGQNYRKALTIVR